MKNSLIVLFSFLLSISYAQDRQIIDSLEQELAKATHDTSRVLLMASISYNYRFLNMDSSMYYGQQALEMANTIDYLKGKVQAINRIAFFYRFTGNLPKSLELSFKVLQLAENHPLEEEIAVSLYAIGSAYNELEEFSKALSFFKKARLVKEKANQTADIVYCYVLMNIGTQFEETNQLDSAWYYFQKTLQVFEKSKIEIIPQLYRHFGNVQFKSGNMPLALGYYRKSLHVTKTIKNQVALSIVLLALSKYYQKVNHPDSSIYYAKNALFVAQNVSSKNREIVESALQLSKLYDKINTDEAFRYYKIAVETRDSLYGKNSLEAIQTIAEQEEEQQRAIEANQLRYQNQLKQYVLLAGLAVLLLIALFLYLNNQKEKKAKMLLQDKNQIIEQTLINLKSTQAQLVQSEKMASLGELTAGIAHEIQNPLNFVNNFSELNGELVKEIKQELAIGNEQLTIGNTQSAIRSWQQAGEIINDIESNSEKINHHGKRAESIVKGMLEHSRKSTGVKEPADINKLCDEFVRLSYHGLRAKDKDFNCDYKLDLDPDMPLVNVVSQDIGRVLLNIVNNAFQACGEKRKNLADLTDINEINRRARLNDTVGQGLSESQEDYKPLVTLTTKFSASLRLCEIIITDNGPGIPDSIKDKIFQPFFTTKPTGQGTGLGLSLAYDIVKAHGGALDVNNLKDGGAEFIIQLPI